MPDPSQIFRAVTDAVAVVVDTEPEPESETPCSAWNYAQLLGHLVGGDRLFVGLLTGHSGLPPATRLAPDPDMPPPSPDDYRKWSTRLAALFDDPAIRAGTFDVPVGRLGGTQVIILRSVEHFLHGWDLAKAGGVSTLGLEPVATALEGSARQLLAAVGDRALSDRRPFASSVPITEDATTAERLVAAFGRDPSWTPDPVAGYARLKERFADHDDVELPDGTRRGFGADGLRVHNRVFACTHQGRLMIKLGADEVDQLIGTGLGAPLSKPGQRPMREWVLLPFDGAAGGRADRAYAFVSGQG
ncbi:MAG TPA: TIGR03086 family metal-binding protein [Microlunatus sp.]